MTDGDALLAAILADPGDDTPRLVYADWLQEHGEDERAELIRVQCEIARTPEPEQLTALGYSGPGGNRHQWQRQCVSCRELLLSDGLCVYHTLSARSRALLQEDRIFGGNWYLWLPHGPFTLWSHPDAGLNVRCEFARGFVHEVECSAADWLAHADAILAAHPVRKVTLTTWPEGSVTAANRQRNWPVTNWDEGREVGAAQFPGVEFEFPRPTFAEQHQRILDSVLRGLALPPHLVAVPPVVYHSILGVPPIT